MWVGICRSCSSCNRNGQGLNVEYGLEMATYI
jgi:hypothetical protein